MFRNSALSILVLFVGTLLGLLVPQQARCQAVPLTSEDLVRRADVIVEGKVTSMTSEWSADRSRIYTKVTLSVDQQIKGERAGNTITVLVPGGEVEGIGEVYSHTARFTKEEDVVVFAAMDRQGQLRVVGGDEGKASVRKEEGTGRMLVSDNESLEIYTAKLRRIVQAQTGQH